MELWWVAFEDVGLQRDGRSMERVLKVGISQNWKILMRNKVCWRDLGPGIGFSRSFWTQGGHSVVLGPETGCLVFGSFQEGNILWVTGSGGLKEFGGSKTVDLEVTRNRILIGLRDPKRENWI